MSIDKEFTTKALTEKIEEILQCISVFEQQEGDLNPPIFPINMAWNEEDVNVLLVAGANASGKSVLGKYVQLVAKDLGGVSRSCSMKNRTASGFESAMIFGDESYQSTGACTIGAVVNGLESSMKSDKPSVMILDEPDVGLSEESSMAMGSYIAQVARRPDTSLRLIVVISHSRALFRSLQADLTATAHRIFVGDTDTSFEAWLNSPVVSCGVEALLNIPEVGMQRFHAYNDVIAETRRKNRNG